MDTDRESRHNVAVGSERSTLMGRQLTNNQIGDNEGKRMPPAKRSTARPAKKTAKKTAKNSAKKATTRPAKKAVKRGGPRKMSAAHKAALAEGRQTSAIVDRYLSALHVPKQRGRKVSLASLQQRLAATEAKLKHASGVARSDRRAGPPRPAGARRRGDGRRNARHQVARGFVRTRGQEVRREARDRLRRLARRGRARAGAQEGRRPPHARLTGTSFTASRADLAGAGRAGRPSAPRRRGARGRSRPSRRYPSRPA